MKGKKLAKKMAAAMDAQLEFLKQIAANHAHTEPEVPPYPLQMLHSLISQLRDGVAQQAESEPTRHLIRVFHPPINLRPISGQLHFVGQTLREILNYLKNKDFKEEAAYRRMKQQVSGRYVNRLYENAYKELMELANKKVADTHGEDEDQKRFRSWLAEMIGKLTDNVSTADKQRRASEVEAAAV